MKSTKNAPAIIPDNIIIFVLAPTASGYGKNFVGGAEHNLPKRNLLVTDAQDDSFVMSSFLRHAVRAWAFKIVQIFSANRDEHF